MVDLPVIWAPSPDALSSAEKCCGPKHVRLARHAAKFTHHGAACGHPNISMRKLNSYAARLPATRATA